MLHLIEGAFPFFALPFVISLICVPIAKRIGFALKVYAVENNRTVHHGKIVQMGGLAVFVAFMISMACFLKADSTINGILIGGSVVFLGGLLDDMINLSPLKKLLFEVAGALIAILVGGIGLTSITLPFGIEINMMPFSFLVSFVWIVGVTNAINLIDGIDGLCSGMAMIDCIFFGIWFYYCGHIEYALMCGVLTAALIPFFLINLFGKRSKMFMGDSGALMVGFLLGVMAIRFCETDINLKGICAVEAAPGVVFSVLAIPVIDTLRLFASRWMRGKSPFAPDKRHLHHKLLTIYNGVHKKATFTILGLNLLFMAFAYIGRDWRNEILVGGDIVLFAVMFYIVDRLAKRKLAQKAAK